MKAILWRFKYLIAALAVFAGLSVPALASASTAVSALPADTTSHPWINDHTGGEQAFVTGSGMNMQDSVNETLDFLWQGTVDNGDNGNCWPFTCGNGLNTYYNNLPVYEVTEAN